jgi:hypothetical protein
LLFFYKKSFIVLVQAPFLSFSLFYSGTICFPLFWETSCIVFGAADAVVVGGVGSGGGGGGGGVGVI